MSLAEPALQAPAFTHQRVDGAARIEFADGPDGTRLADLYQRAPCRLLFPNVAAGEPPQAVLLTTSGGLTGGDRLRIEFRVGAGARATLTTQAAEKIYRALPLAGNVDISVRAEVATGGYAEWLAQETIVFDGGRLRREFVADLAADAALLATESLVLGRSAMNETLRTGFIHDRWRIRRDGRLVFADALHIDGDIERVREAAFGFGDAAACGTLIYAAADAHTRLEDVRAWAREHAPVAHATTREGLLIVRFIAAQAIDVRNAIISIAGRIRHVAFGHAQRLPQVWYC